MQKNRIAIVTGASGGLGKEFVKQLLEDSGVDEIWAVARNKEKLEGLKAECGPKVKIFPVDLSDVKAIESFASVVKEQAPRIAYLINNAGFAKFCSYDDLDIRGSLNMIDVNCSGVVAMCLACIPCMDRGGRIVNIASAASFLPLPYLNIYSATKAFVRNYSRALNVELRGRGVAVTAVCPGWIRTDFIERAQIGAPKAPRRFDGMTTPGKVVSKALQDTRQGKAISVCGLQAKLLHVVSKLLPQKTLMWIWLRQQGL